ncbi:MAG: arginine--tRNA ligase [Candidatus Saccharibacteria bacterium]|nr:arginine--tRNA ligase [Candidatus Saccharibacteria bacterium]
MEEIREQLRQVVTELFGLSEVEIEISKVPDGQEGDYASNIAMRLTKELHKNPREIATEIAEKITGFEVKIAGPGFLNFILPDEYLARRVEDLGANFEKNISQSEYFGKKVICEFSDPNPFKVLHVGHLYTSMVGDSISRLVECAGGEVVRANFGGDVGLHVAKTLFALTTAHKQQSASSADALLASSTSSTASSATPVSLHLTTSEQLQITPEILAKYYVIGTNAYEENEQAKAEITKMNAEIYRIAAEDDYSSELAEAYWTGREVSYKYFEDFYARIGVKFDKYYPESTVAGRGLAEVRKGLADGVYEESNGAVVFPGEKYGLHTRVFINAAGLPTYEAKDVGLLFTKWDDYHFDESVVITGNDIIEYMKVVLKSVSMMQPELSKRTVHITHGNVRLPGNEKMSSRKGNFIKAVDVLNSVEELVPDEKIALGAIRYAFLKYRIGGNIEFDAKESVSTTGNSGVYLQYSGVRARKVLSRCSSALADAPLAHRTLSTAHSDAPAALNNIRANSFSKLEAEERELIMKSLEYKSVLAEAIHELAPHKIANYLYEIAQVFSRFYENVKVAGSEREAELAQVVKVYLMTLEHGLNLLGIEIPEEM